MGRLKQAIDKSYLNEDKILQSILATQPKESPFNIRWMVPVMSFALILLIFFNVNPIQKDPSLQGILSPNQVRAYAVVSLDVNPSFEFYTDMNQNVVDFKLLNDEAQQFDTSTWINTSITTVVDDVIQQALALGYMDLQSTLNKAIVVSSVSFGADNKAILANVQKELALNTNINSSVKTYVIDADEKDYEEAENQHISLGLYMVNRTISVNGSTVTISEFVQNETYMNQLEEIAEHQSDAQLRDIIQALLIEVQSMGVDISSYQARLNSSDVDLEDLVEDIKDLIFDHGPDGDNDEDDQNITSANSNTDESGEIESNSDNKNAESSDDSESDDEHESDD